VWGSGKLRVSGSGSVKKVEVVWIGVCYGGCVKKVYWKL